MTTTNEIEVLKMEAKLAELERDAERFERGERTSRAPVVIEIKTPEELFSGVRQVLVLAGGVR